MKNDVKLTRCKTVIFYDAKFRRFALVHWLGDTNTPNANMADHSVGARDESNGSEASEALMFCFDNAFPEKCCFVVDFVLLFRPPYAFLCS